MPINLFRRALTLVVCSSIISSASIAFGAASSVVNSANVVAAIKRGVNFLLAHETMTPGSKTPCWETGIKAGNVPMMVGGKQSNIPVLHYGGETALVTEALLDVSQSLHIAQLNQYSKPMRTAINFLVRLNAKTTYAASFQANTMTLLPNKPQYKRVLERDRIYLLNSIHRNGAYFYANSPDWPANPNVSYWDNSNTQYGVLGMWACAHQGLSVPYNYWKLAANHWRLTQYMNGAWIYSGTPDHPTIIPNPPPGPAGFTTMTPAGVASLFICDEFLLKHPRLRPTPDPYILRGLAWIDKNFSPSMSNLYAMYGYERVALASGLQTFGGHNWYKDFAKRLLAKQNADGWWGYQDANIGTAYALLILDRGLNPVLINKLQYTKSFYGQWNARQRDAANFTSWVSKTFETPLNWQVVSIESPVSDWLDSPILLITGYQNPHFTPKQIAQLRQYVDAGGMVLCSSDGRSGTFKRAMVRYGKEVTGKQYPVKILPKTSYVYTMQPWYHPQKYNDYLGIMNGSRYLWIICSDDLGGTWQNRRFSRKDYWEIPSNLYFYATGKGALADRLNSLVVAAPAKPLVRNLAMARIKYSGNYNPEPGAWPRMAKLAASDFQTGLTITTLPVSDLNPAKYPLAQMTGTADFHFTGQQVTALRHYLNHGGMLFADATGGNPKFTNAFQKLVNKLYPGKPLTNILPPSSLVTGHFPDGVNVTNVKYRKFYVDSQEGRHTPELLGLKQGKRWIIVFSQDDISSGFLGTHTWGILGYSPQSAQKIARNIILYAIGKH